LARIGQICLVWFGLVQLTSEGKSEHKVTIFFYLDYKHNKVTHGSDIGTYAAHFSAPSPYHLSQWSQW